MKETPIIFTGDSIRKILAGRKTQTRRVCKGQRELSNEHDFQLDRCPYGQPGDFLWVREAHLIVGGVDSANPRVVYRATNDGPGSWISPVWSPSIFMPRWASRLTLKITGVRVERVQEISRGDAMSEGCPFANMAQGPNPCDWYRNLWNKINSKKYPWEANPWVWAISFKVM